MSSVPHPNVEESGYDPTVHQACYVFTATSSAEAKHPAKRRKLDDKPGHSASTSLEPSVPFVPLLNGLESTACVKLRYGTYKTLWAQQEGRIEAILQDVNAKTINGVAEFVNLATPDEYNGKVPAGLILAGPNIASHSFLFQQIETRINLQTGGPFILLNAGESLNLKTVLKKVIKEATNETNEEEVSQSFLRGRKLLNFDLQILQTYVESHGSSRVVIAFQDSDAFDGDLLAELVQTFYSWLDRIPFVLLFGIATSLDIFHEKLPRSAIQLMKGEQFDVERAEESLERIFYEINDPVDFGDQNVLRLGPSLSKLLLTRQREDIQSVQSFVSSLKYAYMSHFYANPLSILLAGSKALEVLQDEHLEAARHLPSFKEHVERFVQKGKLALVRKWLDPGDSKTLMAAIRSSSAAHVQAMNNVREATRLLQIARTCIPGKARLSLSDLYVRGFEVNEDGQDDLVEDLIEAVDKLSSDALSTLFSTLLETAGVGEPSLLELAQIQVDHAKLVEEQAIHGRPLRSGHDLQHSNFRTTFDGRRVELSRQRSALPAHEAAFSEILRRTQEWFSLYFQDHLKSPSQYFLYEAFYYDLKTPHRAAITPKPRFAIERALCAPHDYLNCDCCRQGNELSGSQPPTAILYQLYLESGALINVRDLWEAFYAVIGAEESGEKDERLALALFYRAMAELKLMGMLKQSRKKVDHVAKLAWKGL
ncbi:MAG: hypothetical protein M1824_004766 [Vezdaea acicularis]|nr:MAG: hypothetical protein M1824_004766 [Vezdaea acicularis]